MLYISCTLDFIYLFFVFNSSTTFQNLGDIITVKYTQGEWIGMYLFPFPFSTYFCSYILFGLFTVYVYKYVFFLLFVLIIGVLGSDKTSLPQVNNVNCTAKVALIQESSEFFIGRPNWQGILGLAYAQLAVVCIFMEGLRWI